MSKNNKKKRKFGISLEILHINIFKPGILIENKTHYSMIAFKNILLIGISHDINSKAKKNNSLITR